MAAPYPGALDECAWSPTGAHSPGVGRDYAECRYCDASVRPPADGPGVYEVVLEVRVRAMGGSRRFAELRAADKLASPVTDGGVAVIRSRKVDGPEFADPPGRARS